MQIEEQIETNGELWIRHKNGVVSRKLGNYKKSEPPLLYEYPDIPTGKDEVALSRWYEQYEMAEQQNYFFALKWEKEQKKKIQKIKLTYRKQQLCHSMKRFVQQIFNHSRQR